MICQDWAQLRKKSPPEKRVDEVHPELAFSGGKLINHASDQTFMLWVVLNANLWRLVWLTFFLLKAPVKIEFLKPKPFSGPFFQELTSLEAEAGKASGCLSF